MTADLTLAREPVDQSLVERTSTLLAADRPFRGLLRRRSAFVAVAAGSLLVFNLLQPVLSVFTPALDGKAFGLLTWGWVYAFAQFVVPLALLHVYVARARRFDAAASAMLDRDATLEQAS